MRAGTRSQASPTTTQVGRIFSLTGACHWRQHLRPIRIAEGHRVTHARIEETRLEPNSFDFVYSFHVIEHVEDPTSFMRAIHGAVQPGGYLLIDTPNVDTFDFRLFGRVCRASSRAPR